MKGHTGVLGNKHVLENRSVCFLGDIRNGLSQSVTGLHTNDTPFVWTSANLCRARSHLESGQPGKAEWEHVFLCLGE